MTHIPFLTPPTTRADEIAREFREKLFAKVFAEGWDCGECNYKVPIVEHHGEQFMPPERLRDCDGDTDVCPGVERLLGELNDDT